jgi:hypothetical protein
LADSWLRIVPAFAAICQELLHSEGKKRTT